MEVLLEVVAQREVEERPPVGGQLHRRGQPALDHREVAGGELPVEVGHVRADLEPGLRGQRRRVDARTRRRRSSAASGRAPCARERLDHAAQQRAADARAADRDEAHLLPGAPAELGRSASRSASSAGSKPVT